ncbi:TBC1 domain family member 31 [Episyrphus balteatus]|uniref:TBC1 domain family member 31 n=1 Tax=Episyrphus balteatus TaxID=286459 RepID=UPI002485FB49|nr:TBC1 domain family member 31 [Episyrphus balteatus]
MEESENLATNQTEILLNKIDKSTFKFKKDENGLILTIHHTIKENDNLIRIRLVVGCFNEINRQFLTIDNRGNIFIFDLAKKKYWKLFEKTPKACLACNIPNEPNLYLIATKTGRIYWLDVDKSMITHSESYSNNRISNISFPGIPLKPFLAVVHCHHEAILLNLETHEASHRLEFNQAKISLKFVSYIPQSDQIFTCFTNDSVHIWSGITLNTIRTHNPIRIRDRFLMTKEPIEIRLNDAQTDSNRSQFDINCEEVKEFSKGLINSFSFSSDGGTICFTTLDNFVLFLSSVSFELVKVIKLLDATLHASWIFPKNNDNLLLCQTTKSQLMAIDVDNSGIKLIIEPTDCFRVVLSKDKEFLSTIRQTGEANIYNVNTLIDCLKSAQNCVQMLRTAMSQPKALSINCFDNELRKMLTRSRMIPILKEYGQYPSKYRLLIWTALLDVPCNKSKFSELVKMGTHSTAIALNSSLKLKDSTARRNLIKIFSCLGHWSKVFGHSDFVPEFIFPFMKIFSNSLTVCFEVIATILTNQCQLWFEFHPLEPLNYLGMCENILNHFDSQLGKFYSKIQVTVKEYAWSIISNGFSEILDDEQWLCLWDNILSSPPYFMIFCAVAYNIVQRETILRLESKDDVVEFFHEQNAIDLKKFIKKAYHLMEKCPDGLHPQRYMKDFVKLPKGVYPKFQNYPKKWLEEQESEMDNIRRERQAIDSRMRELERDEALMIEKLERGLQQEEYTKRMKEMQKQYQDMLKREEERISYQRKMLVLYQKELRQQKGKVIELIEESARRRKQNLQESEMDTLLRDIERERQRNEIDLTLAEEHIKDQDLELISHKYGIDDILSETDYQPMRNKFRNTINKINEGKKKLKNDLENILRDDVKIQEDDGKLSALDLNEMESSIRDLEREFQSALKCKS